MITVPNWLLTDPEKKLKVSIRITKITSVELNVNLKVNNDTTFISFVNTNQLPIKSSITILPGETIVKGYEFYVLEGTRQKADNLRI